MRYSFACWKPFLVTVFWNLLQWKKAQNIYKIKKYWFRFSPFQHLNAQLSHSPYLQEGIYALNCKIWVVYKFVGDDCLPIHNSPVSHWIFRCHMFSHSYYIFYCDFQNFYPNIKSHLTLYFCVFLFQIAGKLIDNIFLEM